MIKFLTHKVIYGTVYIFDLGHGGCCTQGDLAFWRLCLPRICTLYARPNEGPKGENSMRVLTVRCYVSPGRTIYAHNKGC